VVDAVFLGGLCGEFGLGGEDVGLDPIGE